MIEIFKRVNPIKEEWVYIHFSFPEVLPIYMISNYGRIFNIFTNTIVNQSKHINHKGREDYYLKVSLYLVDGGSENFLVHRLLLGSFNPIQNFENTIINHIDGIKFHNYLWNLEWSTYSENLKHAYNEGLRPRGSSHNFAVITLDQAIKICEGLESRLSYKDICVNAGLEINEKSESIIYQIRIGNNWKWLSCKYDIPDANRNDQRFTTVEAKFICKCLEENIKTRDILTLLGYDLTIYNKKELKLLFETIGKIRRKERYVDISKDYNF